MDPRSLTREKALEIIKASEPKNLLTILRLVGLLDEDGHWMGGEGWIGPKPELSQPGAAWLVDRIRNGFASQDVATEVTDRKTGGIIGRPPSWSYTVRRETSTKPITQKESALIAEAESAVTTWWDERDIHGWLILAGFTYIATGKANLRFFIPAGLLQDTPDGTGKLPPKASSLAEALSFIYVDHPSPKQATVHLDRRRMSPVGIYSEEQEDGSDVIELVFKEGKDTILRYISQDKTTEFKMDLGGRLTMHEMVGRPLISPHIIALQKVLNFARSMIPRTLETQGFLRQIITNAQMPTEEIIENGVKKEVPAQLELGPEMSAFLTGTKITQEIAPGVQRVSVANPGVHWADPVDSNPVSDVGDKVRAAVLVLAQQGHAVSDDKGAESGESKRQGRADYSSSLRRSAPPVERAGRWLMEGALALAEWILGKPGNWSSQLRAVFECNRDEGPVPAAEQEFLAGAVEDAVLPHEYVLEQLGVQDVGAVMAQIRKSPAYFNKIFEMIEKAFDAGIPRATAVELARRNGMIDDETAALLSPKVEEDVEQ